MNYILSRCSLFIFLIFCFTVPAMSQSDPANKSSSFRQEAFASFDKGDYNGAIKALKVLTKTNAADAEAWNLLGMAYLSAAYPKEGRKACEKAVDLDPNNSSYHVNLAHAFILSGKLDAAVRESDKAIDLQPKNQAAYYVRGTAFLWQGQSEKALENAEKAIELETAYSAAYTLKADALLQTFSRNIGDGVTTIEDLDPLKRSIETLEACA